MMSSGNRADKNKQTNMGIFPSKPKTAEQPSESANLVDAESTSPRSVLQLEPVENMFTAVDKLAGLLDHAKADMASRVSQFCTEKASEQVRQLKQVAYMQQTEDEQRSDTSELKSMIKEIRKHTAEINVHNVCKDFASNYPEYFENPKIWKYVEECVRLCWLMNAQDPPVVFVETPQENADFNIELYKHYTQKGVTMQYLVWPALLLHKGGSLLAKGVAQGLKAAKNPELDTRAETESEPNQGEPKKSTNHDDTATIASGSAGNDKTGFQDARVKRDASTVHTHSQAVKGASNTESPHTFNNIPSGNHQNVTTTQSLDSGSAVPTNRQPGNTWQTQTSTPSQNIGPTNNSNLSGSRRAAASHPDIGTTTQHQNLSATNPDNGTTTQQQNVRATNPDNGATTQQQNVRETNPDNGATTQQQNVRATNPDNGATTQQQKVRATNPDNGATTQQQNLSASTHGRTVKNESGPPPEMAFYYEYYKLGRIECAKRLGKDVFLKCDAYYKSVFGNTE